MSQAGAVVDVVTAVSPPVVVKEHGKVVCMDLVVVVIIVVVEESDTETVSNSFSYLRVVVSGSQSSGSSGSFSGFLGSPSESILFTVLDQR